MLNLEVKLDIATLPLKEGNAYSVRLCNECGDLIAEAMRYDVKELFTYLAKICAAESLEE